MAPSSRPLCADSSREADEPLGATASRIDHWLLVEYPGRWSRDVLGGSALPAGAKEHLREQLASLSHARLLLRPAARPPRARASVTCTPSGAGRRRAPRTAYRSTGRAISPPSTCRRCFAGAGEPIDHPLLVVCTHGKRDRCCSRYGRPLYDALRSDVPPEWVWQSTHVGGDRFAGNLVCLPEGLYFGRVDPAAARDVLARIPRRAHRARALPRPLVPLVPAASGRAPRPRAYGPPRDRWRPLRLDPARVRPRLDRAIRRGRGRARGSCRAGRRRAGVSHLRRRHQAAPAPLRRRRCANRRSVGRLRARAGARARGARRRRARHRGPQR